MNRQQIAIKDFRNQLALTGNKVSLNLLKTGEEDVNSEIQTMKQEIREKKLLEYQLNSKKGDVNEFLKSKYSDGNFNEAIYNGYDNTENRIVNDITFEYHVFFNKRAKTNDSKVDLYLEDRPANMWILTKPVVSSIGDSYIYHIPIRKGFNADGKPIYITDHGEDLDLNGKSINKNGLIYALTELNEKMTKNVNNFSPRTYDILKEFGFIDNNKLNLDISGYFVEKYLKGYLPSKKKEVIEYLNGDFSKNIKEVEIAKDDGPKVEVEKLELDLPETTTTTTTTTRPLTPITTTIEKFVAQSPPAPEVVKKEVKKEVKEVPITKKTISPKQLSTNISALKTYIGDQLKKKPITKLKNGISITIISELNELKDYLKEKMTEKINGEDIADSTESMTEFRLKFDAEFNTVQKSLDEEEKKVEELHEKIVKELELEDKDYEVDYSINSTDEKEYKKYIEKLLLEDDKKQSVIDLKTAAENKLKLYEDVHEKASQLGDKYKDAYKVEMERIINTYKGRISEKKYKLASEEKKSNKRTYDRVVHVIAKHNATVESQEQAAALKKQLEEQAAANLAANQLREEQKKEKEAKENAEAKQQEDEENEKKKAGKTISDIIGIADFKLPSEYGVVHMKKSKAPGGAYSNVEVNFIKEFDPVEKTITIVHIKKVFNTYVEWFKTTMTEYNKSAYNAIKKGKKFELVSTNETINKYLSGLV